MIEGSKKDLRKQVYRVPTSVGVLLESGHRNTLAATRYSQNVPNQLAQ
jgi:hypothetical protein